MTSALGVPWITSPALVPTMVATRPPHRGGAASAGGAVHHTPAAISVIDAVPAKIRRMPDASLRAVPSRMAPEHLPACRL